MALGYDTTLMEPKLRIALEDIAKRKQEDPLNPHDQPETRSAAHDDTPVRPKLPRTTRHEKGPFCEGRAVPQLRRDRGQELVIPGPVGRRAGGDRRARVARA